MVKITLHAIEKFEDIFKLPHDSKSSERRILGMYRKAKEVKLDPVISALRLINNKNRQTYKEAKYYEYESYRMVIVDGFMVTFEKKFEKRSFTQKRHH